MKASLQLFNSGFRVSSILSLCLILALFWPSNLSAQSPEEPNTINPPAELKVSVYDREALSFLIDAPAGVTMEVLGSVDLIQWERLAEMEGTGKPLIWAAPKSLAGPNHFFRIRTAGGVVPLGGPDEEEDPNEGGDEEEGPDSKNPDPNQPDIGEPFPGDGFEVIGPESDLAKKLAAMVMEKLDDHELKLVEIKGGEISGLGEKGTHCFIDLLAMNVDDEELSIYGEFLENKEGEFKLEHVSIARHIDKEDEFVQQMAEGVLKHIGDDELKLEQILSVDMFNENGEEFYIIHLIAASDDAGSIEVFGEVEMGPDGHIEVIHAERDDDMFTNDPEDPDWGEFTVEPVDPESELGKELLEAAMAELEAEGFELQDVILLEKVTEEDHEYFVAVLQCITEDGEELIALVELEHADDGQLKVHQIDIDPIDGGIGIDPIPGGGGIEPPDGGAVDIEELDPKSDIVKQLIDLAMASDQSKGYELEKVVGATRLTFEDEPAIYIVDILLIGEDGKTENAFAEFVETDDGSFEMSNLQIGEVGILPIPEPEPEPDGRILPPKGSKAFFDNPHGDLAGALVTIIHLTIADHVETPWEIENVEELLRWHEPNQGSRFALLAKGADANGNAGHLLVILKRTHESLTIEIDDVRIGIDPEKPIQLPLSPDGGE